MTQIKGKLHHLGDTVVISDKFQKREFVIETSEQYPQFILLQLTNDKCGLLDNAKNGIEITAYTNIRGREWTNPQGEKKWFNTLEAWKLEYGQATTSTPPPIASIPAPSDNVDDSDRVPF